MRYTDSGTAKSCRVLLLSYKTRCAFLTLFWISDCWFWCVRKKFSPFERVKELFASAVTMASLLPRQWGINYRQSEIVHILIKRALLCNTTSVGLPVTTYASLMQLILKISRVENVNTLIVGPALIDTVVLFNVCLSKFYYTWCQIIEELAECLPATLGFTAGMWRDLKLFSVLNYSKKCKAPTCLALINLHSCVPIIWGVVTATVCIQAGTESSDSLCSVRMLLSCWRDGPKDEKTQCYKRDQQILSMVWTGIEPSPKGKKRLVIKKR